MKILVHATLIIGTLFGSDMRLNHGEETRALLREHTPRQVFSRIHRNAYRLAEQNRDYIRALFH